MPLDSLSIGQLADAAGLTRRAIRFYVQQKLIDPPAGLGRGNHYGARHLDQLRRIAELQSAGHSLDEIRQIISASHPAAPAEEVARRCRRIRPLVSAQLWTRLPIAQGIELSFDARRFAPAAHELAALRDAIRAAFGIHDSRSHDPHNGGHDGQDQADG
jgi:DNA-binding transcriptional MerR regulator